MRLFEHMGAGSPITTTPPTRARIPVVQAVLLAVVLAWAMPCQADDVFIAHPHGKQDAGWEWYWNSNVPAPIVRAV